ncbi:hypothetical protein KC335_g67 [Hortaea werneckii]|nr:hypothetical protein KC335_g67 [Hortaea werneckii]
MVFTLCIADFSRFMRAESGISKNREALLHRMYNAAAQRTKNANKIYKSISKLLVARCLHEVRTPTGRCKIQAHVSHCADRLFLPIL